MIQKKPAFVTTDGTTHATLEDAQRAELQRLVTTTAPSVITEEQANIVLNVMFEVIDQVKDILRATGRKARAAKAVKTRVVRRRKADGPVIDVEKAGGDK